MSAYTHEMCNIRAFLDNLVKMQKSLVFEVILDTEHEVGSHVDSPVRGSQSTCKSRKPE